MGCLIKEKANKFRNALKTGIINPDKMMSMNSKQRRDFLSRYVGDENAKWVNAEFESKLLLKNQKQGMITWAKKIGNLKEPARRDIVSKIEKLDNVLSESEQESFLEDLVEKRLGVSVSEEEATKIFDLTKTLKGVEKGTKEYGTAKQELMSYMREKGPTEKVHPVSDVLGVLRSIKTGFDLSASLRQGASMFGTKQWNNAFKNMFGYAKSQTNLDKLEASMYASKYADEIMSVKKELGITMLGESFTQREEEFASRFIKKIPFLEGSSRAYEGFLNDIRFNRFNDILSELDKAGKGITGDKEAMTNLAKVISAATGRGTLGSAEGAAKAFATVMFSPRWVTSRLQTLLNPATKRGVAQKEAGKALGRLAGIATSILGLAKMATLDVETDTRSSDFGKVKIGNTRYDVTGGMGSYIVLMSRLIQGQTKSTITGKITDLDPEKYGGRTRWSLLGDFMSNKTSPIGSAVRDVLKGQTFEGEPLNLDRPKKEMLKYFADQMITPLLYSETSEAYKEASGNNKIATGVGAGLASLFGLSTGSYQYTPRGKKWDNLKEKNKKVYERRVELARVMFKDKMKVLQNSNDFILAPETGENSQAEMIDNIKDKINKRYVG